MITHLTPVETTGHAGDGPESMHTHSTPVETAGHPSKCGGARRTHRIIHCRGKHVLKKADLDYKEAEGTSHLYKRRTFYLDEDSWYISYVDCYDQRDQLWRVQEGHLMTAYDLPAVVAAVEAGYDFVNGRYVVGGLDNLEKPTNYRWQGEDGFFTPAAMRRSGLR